jgi:hypothetical protein
MTCVEKLKQDHPGWTDEDISVFLEDNCPNCANIMDAPDYCNPYVTCGQCWNREIPGTEPDPQPTSTTEAVNHPQHYIREGGMECIDEMILVFGIEATMSFCLLNAWKYRYRAAGKGGEEDLKKSDWYMSKYAELKEGADRVPQ